jgi:hypothetical protein
MSLSSRPEHRFQPRYCRFATNRLKPSGYYMNRVFQHTKTPHSVHTVHLCVSCEVRTVYVCSVWFSQQTATVSPHRINRFGSVAET